MDLGLRDQNILVTGGSSGIGLETARLLLDEDALVTICGRDADRLRAAATELDSSRLRTVRADVRNADDANAAVEAAVVHGERLDGVAAVAGRGRHGSLLDMETDEVIAEVSDKLTSLLNVTRPAIPHLQRTRGRLVGLSAPTAPRPDPAMGAIAAGRAALDSAIGSLALELAHLGVRVNAVGVGLIDTPRQRTRHFNSKSPDDYRAWLLAEATRRSIPMKRAGTAHEVASAICWLLSPLSDYTTGAVLDVTGGLRSH